MADNEQKDLVDRISGCLRSANSNNKLGYTWPALGYLKRARDALKEVNADSRNAETAPEALREIAYTADELLARIYHKTIGKEDALNQVDDGFGRCPQDVINYFASQGFNTEPLIEKSEQAKVGYIQPPTQNVWDFTVTDHERSVSKLTATNAMDATQLQIELGNDQERLSRPYKMTSKQV